ncbi:MAG: ABC transporter ATP-binding protein [Coriobacteriia bacterium]
MARSGSSLASVAKTEHARDARSTLGRLFGYLQPHRAGILTGFAWVVVTAINTAAAPAITGLVIDTALAAAKTGGDTAPLTLPVAALIVSAFVGWFGQRMQILVIGTIGQKALFSVRQDVFGAIGRLSVAYFESAETGDVLSRLVNDIDQISSFLSQGFRRVLASSLGVSFTLVGMLLVEPRLAGVTLLVVPLMVLTSRAFGTVARRVFRRRQEAIGDVSATLAEELAGIRVAQAFARTDHNAAQFAERNAASRDASITAATVSSAFQPVLGVIAALSTALVAGFGGALAARDLVSVGVVVAFFNYSRSFFNAISQLSSLWPETQSALAGAERVFELVDTPSAVTDAPDAIVLERVRGDVSFEGVGFAYGGGHEVLHDIELQIETGTTLAIVGPTGGGKTTLVNLLARFYDPTSGRVLVDGHDLRSVTVGSYRANLGIVLQEPFLFDGTIAENIRYGRLDATDEEIRAAAALARATDFVDSLPRGFGTLVGDRGALLSAGQKQLVAFARAVLADPAILILDEATSSVDTRTERLIQESLKDVLAGRTALIIAHRLSTVRTADRIIVIDDGRIAEEGTYAQLIAANGLFASLHAAQFAGE